MTLFRGTAKEFGWQLIETNGRKEIWERPDGQMWLHDRSRGPLRLMKAPDPPNFRDYNDPKEIDRT